MAGKLGTRMNPLFIFFVAAFLFLLPLFLGGVGSGVLFACLRSSPLTSWAPHSHVVTVAKKERKCIHLVPRYGKATADHLRSWESCICFCALECCFVVTCAHGWWCLNVLFSALLLLLLLFPLPRVVTLSRIKKTLTLFLFGTWHEKQRLTLEIFSFSFRSHGFVIGHVVPEAQVGGPIALVKDGDVISVDAVKNSIEVNVSEEEMERRRKEWKAPPLKVSQGTLYKYTKVVTDASSGCVTDA